MSDPQLLLSCFCCHHCPGCCGGRVSTTTRMTYYVIFAANTVINIILVFAKVVSTYLPFCYKDNSFVCRRYSAYLAVYRVSFAFEILFLMLWVLTVQITSSRNPRAAIHNGFWFYKVTFLLLLIAAFCFIPYGWFDTVLMYVAVILIVGFHNFEMFALCQITVNIAYVSYEKFWVQNSCWKFLCTLGIVILAVCGLLVGALLLIIYSKCVMNIVLVSVNLILSYTLALAMGLVRIRRNEKIEALQGFVMASFVMVVTWSAIANNEDESCNPERNLSEILFSVINGISIWLAFTSIGYGLQYLMTDIELDRENAIVLLEERGTECCGVWGKPEVVDTLSVPGAPNIGIIYTTTDDLDDEYEIARYSWSSFHHILLNALFYLMFCMSRNYYLYWDYDSKLPDHANNPAMWSKLVSTWFCLILFFFAGLFRRKLAY